MAERKPASIRKIHELAPIEGADLIELKRLRGDPDRDFPPEMSEVALTIRDLEFERDKLREKLSEAKSLLDGCYEVIELWQAKTVSQFEWKRKWLESARNHGVSGT